LGQDIDERAEGDACVEIIAAASLGYGAWSARRRSTLSGV
jgi:hypothetical protein